MRNIPGTILALSLLVSCANAQLAPSVTVRPTVTDPRMVLDVGGAKVEVFANTRAVISTNAAGQQRISGKSIVGASTPISPKQPGLVFSHSLQAYGYITGEIALKFKANEGIPPGFPLSRYPGLHKVGTLNLYVYNAQTETDFVDAVGLLSARDDVAWVSPQVEYIPSAGGLSTK